MNAWSFHSRSAEETADLARSLARQMQPGTVLALYGELGAGKTTFVQGLAAGLGVIELAEVVSPTYALVHEHSARDLTLVHVDLYRLDDPESLWALGIREQLARSDAVVVVEWPERAPEELGGAASVRITFHAESERHIQVEGLPRPA